MTDEQLTTEELAEKVRRGRMAGSLDVRTIEADRALDSILARLDAVTKQADCGNVDCGVCQQCVAARLVLAQVALDTVTKERDEARKLVHIWELTPTLRAANERARAAEADAAKARSDLAGYKQLLAYNDRTVEKLREDAEALARALEQIGGAKTG